MRRNLLIPAALLLLCSAALVGAQPAATTKPPETVVVTYNLSDLIRPAPDAPLPDHAFLDLDQTMPRGNGGGGGIISSDNPGEMNIENIARLVKELIDPSTWEDHGGETGQISIVGGLLVVRQTRETQARVGDLLRDIRNNSAPSRPVRVQAIWYAVDDAQPLRVGEKIAPDATLRAYARAETTCFSGQTVHVMSNREQTYVADVSPIVGTNSALFDTEIGVARSGVMLQISPQLVPETNSATIDVISIASQIEALDQPTTVPSGDIRQAQIDRVRQIRSRLQTTIRLPLGEPTIVGGMTLDVASQEKKTLVLVLQVDALATP